MSLEVRDLGIGSVIYDENTKYNGAVIKWIIIERDRYADDSVLLLSEDIITYKSFDAIEPNNPNEYRSENGNHLYEYSNIRQWLNSDERYWYSDTHEYDQRPSSGYVYKGYNAYSNESGFLTNFSNNFKKLILESSISVDAHDEYLKDKIFLLSISDSKYTSYFSGRGDEFRKAYPTPQASQKNEKNDDENTWYLRTRGRSFGSDTSCYISDYGGVSNNRIPCSSTGIRPAVNIANSSIVQRDNSGEYRLVFNEDPVINDKTESNKTLYDGDVIDINGTVIDEDKDDVVTIKYNINNGTARVLSSQISQGIPIPYNKSLTFKEGCLYDGDTKISEKLGDDSNYSIKIWAEDDRGGKSKEHVISFKVVNNIPPEIQIDEIEEYTDLIENDYIEITGSVSDPNKDQITLSYKINSNNFIDVNKGSDRDFKLKIKLNELEDGNNIITIKATDIYDANTTKKIMLEKNKKILSLKKAIREYKLVSYNESVKNVLFWIRKDIGDLTTKVEIKFGDRPYMELEKQNTINITSTINEDEYYCENENEETDIWLRITMNRESGSSEESIRSINGIFNSEYHQ